MAKSKDLEKSLAKILYVEKGLTLSAIAEQVGVLPKTVGVWAKEGEWDKLRAGYLGTPTMTVAALLNSINAIAEAAAKDSRAINAKEADTIAKLTASIKSIKKELNVAIYVEIFMEFGTWLFGLSPDDAKRFNDYQKQFISEKARSIK